MKNETMQKIAAKVLLHMEIEKLMNTEAGKLLDINPAYLSMIKRPEQYDKCPMKAWRKMHVWYHSGSNLRDYDWRKAPEVPDVHPEEEATETIPEVRRTAPPKPEPPKEEPPKPKGEKPAAPPPPPIPDFKHETETITAPVDLEITKHVFHPRKPKDKPGRPSQEEIERVLATLGIEIAIVVKLKNKQD